MNIKYEFAGFGIRLGAYTIDFIASILVSAPILYTIYGAGYFDPNNEFRLWGVWDLLVNYILPIGFCSFLLV